MDVELAPLEPAQQRTARHHMHLCDGIYGGEFHALIIGENRFLIHVEDDQVYVYPPFESAITAPLRTVAAVAATLGSRVHVEWPDEAFARLGGDTAFSDMWSSIRVYQTPYPLEHYAARLQRFRSRDWSFRPLEAADMPAVKLLVDETYGRHQQSLVETRDGILSGKITSSDPDALDVLANRLDYLGERLACTVDDYAGQLEDPLVEFSGCFEDDQLLAVLSSYGNNHFREIDIRAGVRRNSYSPQEFLDLSVFREFAQRRIPIIDRGYRTKCRNDLALVDYKQKFGLLREVPLSMRYDVTVM